MPAVPEIVLFNGKITTLDADDPVADAVAIGGGAVVGVGSGSDMAALAGPATRSIDLGGRRVIPGLNDSHTHVIRGGLTFNAELRWDGLASLADAMRMLRDQAQRTPPPQWVRVVGGWSEFQFVERRMPTLGELNAVAPDTPVFVLHLYDRALLNRAALRAIGYTRETPAPPGGLIERNAQGELTGLLIATPNARLLYAALGKGPKLAFDDQLNSTRHFMRELNRLGVTSVIDAGGGAQDYPDDYAVVETLHRQGLLTVRIAYNLFTQNPAGELADFMRWSDSVRPGQGDAMYRLNGAGEMLVYSAADFEDFMQPRPELPATMERDLSSVVRLLVERRWPFRLHATYDESIGRALDVFEAVEREQPFDGLRFIIDHAETISPANIDRIGALGGGIAIQHRMAFQGEHFVDRYGARAAEATPPVARMLAAGIPVGAGTDATRVASYNPWIALRWLVSGRTVGGLALYPARNCLDRETALALWTKGSAWFSGEEASKGAIRIGEYADLAVLSDDYFSVPVDAIGAITSVLTIVGGRIVHGDDEYAGLAPSMPPPSPDWSPVAAYGAYARRSRIGERTGHARADDGINGCRVHGHTHGHAQGRARNSRVAAADPKAFWGALGCSCFAF